MKMIRSHRFRNSLQLFFMLLFISIFIIFRDNFIEVFNSSKSPDFISYMFFVSIIIGVIVILYTSISELIKSKVKIKEEYIQLLNNRKKNHLKIVSEIENEIEKLNECKK